MSNRLLPLALLLAATQACNRTPQPLGRDDPSVARNPVTPLGNASGGSNVAGAAVTGGAVDGAPSNPGAAPGALGAPGNPGASNASSGASDNAGALTDPQIAAITNAANSAEIEQAQLAVSKAKDPRVKDFATMMIKHHTEAKNKQAQLAIKPASSPTSTKLEKDSQDALSKLKSATSADFDEAYINAQVDEHQNVVTTIERDLMPNAKSPGLKNYLAEIKPTVESHLKKAKDLQGKLHQSASAK